VGTRGPRKKPDVRALIETQLRGPRASFSRTRRELDKLADGNDPEVLRDFVVLWSDGDADIRFWAMTYAHPMLRDGVKIDGLAEKLEALLADDLPANRQMAMAIYATQRASLPKSLIHLVTANIRDTRAFTHHEAIRTLGKLAEDAAPYVSLIIDALNSEDTRSAASIALKLLAPHIPAELRADIESHAKQSSDDGVRAQLAVAVKEWQGT
jgi:hypothetical protein